MIPIASKANLLCSFHLAVNSGLTTVDCARKPEFRFFIGPVILLGMAAHKSFAAMKGDEHVVGIELPIVQVLSSSGSPTDYAIEFPADLKICTSTPRATEALGNASRMREIGEQLSFLLEKIMNWNYIRLKTWEHSLGKVAECVQDIEEMQKLIESLSYLSVNGCQEDGIPHRVYSILWMALSRLEEEFSYILSKSKQPLELENLSFCSKDDVMSFFNSIVALNNQLSKKTQVKPQRDNNTRGLKEYIINLVHPNIIPILKCIAEVLFMSGYDAKCCQAYISIRKGVLEECLLVLEVEKLSIKDVLQMNWVSLNSKIEKWIQVVKVFVTVYLASEKSLAHKIFGTFGSVGQICFIEASKGLILQLLNFGKAVASKNDSPENILPVLYMYDGLRSLLSNIQALFLYEIGSSVSTEAHEILSELADSTRRALNEFKYVIIKNKSSSSFAGSGVHHLTMIVMSYLETLTNHCDTLNSLLKGSGPEEGDRDDRSPSSSIMNNAIKDDSEWSSSHVSPIARYLLFTISMLESKLESKSQIYTDVALKHFFLMNNIYYMAQKVKESKLQPLLGENWIREHDEKFQKHAIDYERSSWSPVLSFLTDAGINIPQPGSVSKASLKVRFQCFKIAFEEIYRTQTTWFIPHLKLREDLQISISSKLQQAYQTFLATYFCQLPGKRHKDKYIKYYEKDLQRYLLDLFEGSPKSLAKSPSLKEEFSHILIENKQPLVPEHLPFQSSGDDMPSVDLIASVDDEASESTKVTYQRNNMKGLEEYIIDLVHPNVIPDLKFIAEVMFASGYDAECCQAYMSIRKDALEECLLVLKVENHTINDVLLMDWSTLNSKIKKWVQAAKIFVCVCLPSEKILAQKVFEVSESAAQNCFIDASKDLISRFLHFGEAVAMRKHSPEKICSILCICDGLMGLLPNLDLLFSNEACSCVSTEAHGVLSGLGESVIGTLNQFKKAIKTNELHVPLGRGGVHHLTRYVMKYLKALTDYSHTLNFVLQVVGEDNLSSSSTVNRANDNDDNERNSSDSVLPVARCLQCMISALELNLEGKFQVYTDVSQQHFFLMTNICYIVQKVKDSELEPLVGESWLRKQEGKFLQHALNYEKVTWSPVLSFLRDEGIWNPRSGSVSKAILKERMLGFNLAFEEIYRNQRMWLIDDAQLRDHLRISISSKVFLAYRSFLERYSSQLAGRYMKYSADDLVESLLDLFEGSPKPLHRSHRR